MKRIPKQEYTAEFKEQAVKRADEVGSIARAAEELGLVEQTLRNCVKAAKAGKLNPAGAKQITAEQMELSRLRAQVARLEMENENLKKSDGIFREGAAVKYVWIEKQRRSFLLPVLCDALSVSQSGFRAWQAGGTPQRKRLTDAQALVLIRTIHQEVRQAYGARRIHAELRGRGHRIGLPRIERLMRENGIRARHKRRYKATTDSRHSLPVAANVLDRHFAPDAPNRVWTGDITYIATAEGWLYLAVVIDLFNREVIGWSIKPRMTTDLVLDALSMAWFRRRPEAGVLFHSDRGSQYASHAYQARLATYGIRGSMSRKGNCWDNAPTESFFNSLKNERVHGVSYATRNEATSDLFQYIAVFYNRSRRHSTLGYLSPTTFLQNWIEQQNQQEMAA
ncbi:IS3 family transposase [Aromatoleum toluclasticum]|uniref:IS3 family transposase n=1 Tax=Aromatoleum toluclasticum TaxID=92003 RepID=UPI001D190AB1|nr:IS3 family transposase [Aromatoleum toluclasticum]MCC4114749.1 IS3 family transposase [Aromatoleum toluclasticum]